MPCARWRFAERGLLAAALLLAGSAGAAPCPAAPLRIAFPDTALADYLVGQGSQFAKPEPGHLVRETIQALEVLGCPAELTRLPLPRLAPALAQGQIDVVIPLAPTPERLLQLRFPELADGRPNPQLALADVQLAIYGLSARADSLESQVRQGPNRTLSLGVLRGSLMENLAQARGWRTQLVPDIARGLQMLRRGHVDLLLAPQVLMTSAQLASEPALQRYGAPVGVLHYYAPVSQMLWQQHPAFVRRLWHQLCVASQARRPSATHCPLERLSAPLPPPPA